MILLNKGLTPDEKAKVCSPYAANCGRDAYDLEEAGRQAAVFIERNEAAFQTAIQLLNKAHSSQASGGAPSQAAS